MSLWIGRASSPLGWELEAGLFSFRLELLGQGRFPPSAWLLPVLGRGSAFSLEAPWTGMVPCLSAWGDRAVLSDWTLLGGRTG